jgi:hypothetical protein
VKSKEADNPVTEITDFLGDKAVDMGGVTGALASFGAEIGGAAINEAISFVKQHHKTLFSMTKNEFSFVFEKIFRKGGEFDEEAYKSLVSSLDEESLIAEAEANADAMAGIRKRVDAKKEMLGDLLHTMSVLARFALTKAISIASHGIL